MSVAHPQEKVLMDYSDSFSDVESRWTGDKRVYFFKNVRIIEHLGHSSQLYA